MWSSRRPPRSSSFVSSWTAASAVIRSKTTCTTTTTRTRTTLRGVRIQEQQHRGPTMGPAGNATRSNSNNNTSRRTLRFQQQQRLLSHNMTRSNNSSGTRALRFQRQPPRKANKAARTPSSSRSFSDQNRADETSVEGLSARLEEIGAQTPGGWTAWLQSKNLSADQRQVLTDLLRRQSNNNNNNSATAAAAVPEPSRRALRLVALNTAIPFVGFGFLDNAILIVAGDAIDTSLGVLLGISTMCAAALGNIISDVAGIMLGTAIEDFCVHYLRLPAPDLTTAQRQLRSVRFASQWGCAVGVVVGCIIGMFPLMFIDSHKVQARKREAHLDQLFRDVVTSAGSLVGAARTSLYLLVNDPAEKEQQQQQQHGSDGKIVLRPAASSASSPRPTPDGKFLYVKVDDTSSGGSGSKKEQWIPLGRGIVSRGILTGESWNIPDVDAEPDFVPEIGYVDYNNASQKTRSMIVVPVMDSSGRPIAVIQAINKVGKGREDQQTAEDADNAKSSGGLFSSSTDSREARPFSDSDVQILKALATHISVSLQRIHEEAEGDQAEMRLKDTVRLLHDYGLAGIAADQADERDGGLGVMKLARRPLFPEE